MPPTPREREIRALIHQACGGDQAKIGMTNIFWNMYCESDWAQSQIQQDFRTKNIGAKEYYNIGLVAYRVIQILLPRVTRDALEAMSGRVFLCDNQSEALEAWGHQLGKFLDIGNGFARYPMCFGNYMRAGMRSMLDVIAKHDLCPMKGDISQLRKFVNDCLTGFKVYPTMVWGANDPLLAIMEQATIEAAGKGTAITKWVPHLERRIQDIIDEGIRNCEYGDASDLYGRRVVESQYSDEAKKTTLAAGIPTNFNRMRGTALLDLYKKLTSGGTPLARYHFNNFWNRVFHCVAVSKGWEKRRSENDQREGDIDNLEDVGYLLFQNRHTIIQCLGPYVPLSEAERFTKDNIKDIIRSVPPLALEYTPKMTLPKIMINGPAQVLNWQQFEGITQQDLAKINWNERDMVRLAAAIKGTKLNGPLKRKSDSRSFVLKAVRSMALEYEAKA
jgi:hypothetical protein